MKIDPELLEFATDRQKEYIQAVNDNGGYRAASKALGLTPDAVRMGLAGLLRRAAREGYAPGHWNDGVAPGYQMGKVTVQRGPNGVERVWERQHPGQHFDIEERIAAACVGIPRLAPIPRPKVTKEKLLNLYTITDYHMGMAASKREGGSDWNLKIAEETLVAAFEMLVETSPPAGTAFINQLGDFLHFDGLVPMTPTSHHVVDAAARFEEMYDVSVRVLMRLVDIALMKHDQVVLLCAEGNHDLASSATLRVLFKHLYANEPRVEVLNNGSPYYAYEFGTNMLGFHHGHKKAKHSLPLLMATEFSEMWGRTKKRTCHTGHQHHTDEKEHPGMVVNQHRTLAARDSHASRGGWQSEREADAITYHHDFGQMARAYVCPEMLEAA